jgi:hypothetical protein
MARAVFEKIALWDSAPKAPVFGTRMFIFSGHQPVVDGLLKVDYEQNPFNRSGASE